MCLATVYVERHGEKEEVMQDVAWIKPQARGLRLIGLMGESRLVQAKIMDINLMSSSIILEGERPATRNDGYPIIDCGIQVARRRPTNATTALGRAVFTGWARQYLPDAGCGPRPSPAVLVP